MVKRPTSGAGNNNAAVTICKFHESSCMPEIRLDTYCRRPSAKFERLNSYFRQTGITKLNFVQGISQIRLVENQMTFKMSADDSYCAGYSKLKAMMCMLLLDHPKNVWSRKRMLLGIGAAIQVLLFLNLNMKLHPGICIHIHDDMQIVRTANFSKRALLKLNFVCIHIHDDKRILYKKKTKME